MSAKDSKKLARFWLIMTAGLAAFGAMPEFYDDVSGRKAGGLALLHKALRWLFVEPMGVGGAAIFIVSFGAFAAWLSWPKTEE